MKIGILLLDQKDQYISESGKLPKRPSFDKELLVGLCDGKQLLCDGNSLNDLPPSLRKNNICEITGINDWGEICISPNTIDKYADILIISRSEEKMENGKTFRMNKFKNLAKQMELEIWIRK